MATGQINQVIERLRRTALIRDGAGLDDRQLLEAYIQHADDAALAALVRRHAAMVWGVCRRILQHHHDAEDAFQATFLVLVRRARSIAARELLANWLYGVACQTARKARATAAKRSTRERQVSTMPEAEPAQNQHSQDIEDLLDQELSRLPDKYRAVLILCDLQDKTRKQAAQELRCPEGTIAGRLARARAMLAKRLVQRGAVLPGVSAATLLSEVSAKASVPSSVISSTIKATTMYAAGKTAAVAISVNAVALTEGVLKTMLLTKLKTVTILLVLAAGMMGVGFSGGGGWSLQPSVAGEGHPKQAIQGRPQEPSQLTEAKEKLVKAKLTFDIARIEHQDALLRLEHVKAKLAVMEQQLRQAQATYDALKAQIQAGNVRNAQRPPQKQAAGEKSADPIIDAADLVRAYQTNQAKADELYTNKKITVRGKLARVFRSPPGVASSDGKPDYIVELQTELPVQFLFASRHQTALAKLKENETVTIRADCRGMVPGSITPTGPSNKQPSLHLYGVEIMQKPAAHDASNRRPDQKEPQVLTPEQAIKAESKEKVTVEFEVGAAMFDVLKAVLLNPKVGPKDGSTFQVVITRKAYDDNKYDLAFVAAAGRNDLLDRRFRNKVVRVTGILRSRRDSATKQMKHQFYVTAPDSYRIVK